MSRKPKLEPTPWDTLWGLIKAYADASRAHEMRGGGDQDDVPLIDAELTVSELRLEAHINKMKRNMEDV